MTCVAYKHCRGGYVLLVTLALLVLSTTLLVAVGRATARHALDARLRQDEVQRRWAQASCRSAVLPNVERILASIEQRAHGPAAEFTALVDLGPDRLTVVVADEQAKANVNALLDQSGRPEVEDRVRELLSGSGLNNHVRLRPSPADDDPPATRPVGVVELIRGPGQIFDRVGPEALFAGRTDPTGSLTWWGDGSLNVMRAGRPAMRAALTPALSRVEVDRLVDARDRVAALSITGRAPVDLRPTAGADAVGNLLSIANVDAKMRNKLAVTTRSQCHSVRIILDDGRRLWFTLSASDETAGRRPRVETIAW